MKRKVANKIERLRRTYQIYQWLCKGWSTSKIIQNSEQLWGIKHSMVEYYLRRARELLTKRMQKDMNHQAGDILKKLDAIHERAFEEGTVKYTKEGGEYLDFDLSTARQVQMDKAKILGLLTNKIDMTVNDERELTSLSDDELEFASTLTEH